VAEALAGAPRRAIALVERELDDQPSMLTMRELAPATDADDGPLVNLVDGGETTRYRSVAAHFQDTTTFFPVLDEYEVWLLINLTGDTHPIHVHLDPFQILARRPIRYQIPDGGIGDRDLTATVTVERGHRRPPRPHDRRQRAGLKTPSASTPARSSEIAVRFTTYSGRYMYHCHILEHEDRDMMRPS
jgi:spore coat protein A